MRRDHLPDRLPPFDHTRKPHRRRHPADWNDDGCQQVSVCEREVALCGACHARAAGLIVTSNTGCHMQLVAGVRRAGSAARVAHVVEVLSMSYESER